MEASPARACTVAGDSGADAIVRALAQAGTRLVFGVPGGGPNLDVVGAADAAGLRFILAHGETAAVIMAATCADLAGPPGAVVVTRGPGLASAVNGIAHAALDRLPVVVIADTVAAADASRVSHQRIDQAALGRSVAKAAITVGRRHPGEAAARIIRTALAVPPGPVIANMDDSTPGPGADRSLDADPAERGAPADSDPAGSDPAGSDPPAAAWEASLLAGALRTARRPVLMLGADGIPQTAAIRTALATHRKKVAWLRKVPNATFLLMNPENTYHWLSLKTVVKREVSEDNPVQGQRVTDQLDRIWVKYTGNEPPYALRDPSMDERRVLFELEVVKVATFGRP